MKHRFLTVCGFALLMLPGHGLAQPAVALRTGTHQGYTRLVFDWPSAVKYQISRSGSGDVGIQFDSPATIDLKSFSPDAQAGIANLKVTGDAAAKLALSLKLSEDADFRHFMAGNRVVIDVFKKEAAVQPSKKESTPLKERPKPAETKAEASDKKDIKKTEDLKVTATPVEPVKAEPVVSTQEDKKSVLQAAETTMDAHVISFSSTEALGMAVYEREGWLWLVMDRSDVYVPPQIAGPHPEKFPAFEKFELKGGVAYRTRIPEGMGAYVYGEGGGLVWRVVITPNKREKTPAKMARAFEANSTVRGGTLTWALKTATKILDVPDPAMGDIVRAVTVKQADAFTGSARELVDLDVLRSAVGAAFLPHVDDLEIKLASPGVVVTKSGGLAISRDKDVNRRMMREKVVDPKNPEGTAQAQQMRRVFDFDRWMMGGLQALNENQRILLSGMGAKDKNGRVQDLLALAKMNVANDRGQEALGFLGFAEDEIPAIVDGPEYLALRGASYALAGKPESAFVDLFVTALKDYGELDFWRAFVLASLEDWKQAAEVMPADLSVLAGYPKALLEKMTIKLAEVALRAGKAPQAEAILALLNKDKETLRPWTLAGLDYLRGEAHRQKGDYESAKKLWDPLSTGPDDFYRARAGLAMTLLELQNGKMEYEKAIDRLEGLRYSWRGDEIEAQINFTLGKLYVDRDQYMKGFTILRDAAGMSPDSDVGRDVTDYMTRRFADLLINDKDLTPLDAVTVYEEFRELTPAGEEGNRLIQKLAERLVEADLLDRASGVLQHQADFRLQGLEKATVLNRLGAIYLLNRSAPPALRALDQARSVYETALTGDEQKAKLREIDLLRARAMSQVNKTEEALEMLLKMPPDPDVNRLRADIAWQARLWEDAAEALQDLVLDEAMDPNRPLTDTQTDLILNRAVALNLSGDRVALANIRKQYYEPMKKTPRARLFDVVTRPRQASILSDRQTIDALVEEVDMFKGFLEAYRKERGGT